MLLVFFFCKNKYQCVSITTTSTNVVEKKKKTLNCENQKNTLYLRLSIFFESLKFIKRPWLSYALTKWGWRVEIFHQHFQDFHFRITRIFHQLKQWLICNFFLVVVTFSSSFTTVFLSFRFEIYWIKKSSFSFFGFCYCLLGSFFSIPQFLNIFLKLFSFFFWKIFNFFFV